MAIHASSDIAAERRQTEKLAAAGDPLAIAQVEAWQRVAAAEPTSGISSIAGFVPAAAQFVSGVFTRKRPKLWASETNRFDAKRDFDLDVWRNSFRQSGHVQRSHYGFAIIEVLYRRARISRSRSIAAVITMQEISATVGSCVDTVRRFVRQAELDGFIDTWNRTARRTSGELKGHVLREANAYVPILPELDLADARAAPAHSAEAVLPDDKTLSPAQIWLGRLARQLRRGERYFRGLVGRKIGLNLSPLKARTAPA